MFCSKCGTQCPDGSNFCMKCGFNFVTSAATAAPAAPVAAQPAAGQAAGSTPPIIDGKIWLQNSGVVNPYPVPNPYPYDHTFHCRCEYCYYEFDYHTYDLGHRAWYPHGFVYCPRCKRPLRHRLENEVNGELAPAQPGADQPAPAPAVPAPDAPAQG